MRTRRTRSTHLDLDIEEPALLALLIAVSDGADGGALVDATDLDRTRRR